MSIAILCVLIAGILPILVAGYAKRLGGGYDNSKPRDVALRYEGAAKRAHAAHLNSYEAFPLFAAAVLLAEMKGAPRGLMDVLAVTFIGLRMGYIWTYVSDQSTLRSIAWALGLFATIAIFMSPLWR